MALTLVQAGLADAVHAQNLDSARQSFDFDIPSQRLENALAQFSRITAVSVLNDSASVSGRTSARLKGRMSVQQAILGMLQGTGLRARFTSGGSIAITPAIRADIVLDQLDAVNRPLLGRPPVDPAWVAYAELVQRRIRADMGRDARLSRGRYHIGLKLWVTPDGRIARQKLSSGSGDEVRDRLFSDVLAGLSLGEKPPANLPQPIKLEFEVR